MPEPIEVQYHNCSFVHLLMQKQSGNDVKETKVAANQEKVFKKERQNNSKGATKFISCSAPDLKSSIWCSLLLCQNWWILVIIKVKTQLINLGLVLCLFHTFSDAGVDIATIFHYKVAVPRC